MIQPSASTSRAPREIPVRRITFDFSRVKSPHWFGGDPFQSHLLHALSLTFPDGERFFMDAVRHYVDRIDSPALRHEIARFLAQEAAHGKAHEAFNDWVRALGLDAEPIVQEVQENLRVARTHPPRAQLAATCALEHFTAILAELLFENDELRAQMDPEMLRLWQWHALEETEHKAVAFDTYAAVGGTYRTRITIMLFTTVTFLANVARFQARLIKSDAALGPSPDVPQMMLRGWFRLWVYPGTFRPLVGSYLDYFRRDFHPWQRTPKGGYEAARAAFRPDAKGYA